MQGKQVIRQLFHVLLIPVFVALKKEEAKWIKPRGVFLSSFSFQILFAVENVAFMTGGEDRMKREGGEALLVTLEESLFRRMLTSLG